MTAPATAAVAALGEAVAAALSPEQQLDDDDRQLGLFSEPVTLAGLAKLPAKARGPGRPRGALNRKTLATTEHLLQRYRNPLAIALERIEMHPADLAGVLGCSVSEAEDKQRLWFTAAAPFLLAKITPDNVTKVQAINLFMDTGEGWGAARTAAIELAQVVDAAPAADVPSAATIDNSKA